MANNLTDLVNVALENLRVKPAMQAANPEDVALVKARVQPTIALLIGKNIALASDTADLTDIPDAILLPLAACVAAQCATAFMVSDATRQELEAEQARAIDDLTLIYRQGFAGRRLKVDFRGRCRRWH